MVRIRLVNTIFNRVKKTPLVFSLLISFISLFLIYSHVLEMILMLGFGGIAFLLLEFLLWPILFLISPGMIITKLILPRLDNFLYSIGQQATFDDNGMLVIVVLCVFIINALYYLFVSFLIQKFSLNLKNVLRCYAVTAIVLFIILSISVFKAGAIALILFLIGVTVIKKYLNRKR